jgi:hypothetical protein
MTAGALQDVRLPRRCAPRNDKTPILVIASDSKNRAAISTVTMELFQQVPGSLFAFQAQHLAVIQ